MASNTSLGVGAGGVLSIGPRMQVVSGLQCLAQSLARRLITPRGSLSWAPNDGTDMREFLNKGNTSTNRFAAASAARDECLKDSRVERCDAVAQFSAASSQLSITLSIATADGPFQLVIGVDALTVQILEAT